MANNSKHTGSKKIYILLGTLTAIMVVLVAVALILYARQMKAVEGLKSDGMSGDRYTGHYAMIVEDGADEFWQSVYAGALSEAESQNIYLEFMGEDLNVSYSTEELVKMAIAAKVDGIMLEADGSGELDLLIEDAVDAGIPVVTLLKDAAGSLRVSYVGISYYNLGQQYAEQIVSVIAGRELASKGEINVLVLMDNDINDTSRNIVYSSIRDVLNGRQDTKDRVKLNSEPVDSSTAFAAEESIRNLFLSAETLPDIIVCLDETSSACVYQAIVDYNQVGRVELVGDYTGTTVLSGISKKIIYSTTGVDTEALGKNGVDALTEYIETGYVSEYYSVDTFIVNQYDIDDYMGGGDN